MLPAVIRFNAQHDDARACYANLAARAGLAGNPSNLSGYGVRADDVDDLAAAAATQWTGTFNPRPVDADAFRDLYLAASGITA